MKVRRYLADTNVLLRFLLGQPVLQAESTRLLFAQAANGEVLLEIYPIIVAEAFYTLTSFYGIERKEAAVKLATLVQQPGIKLRDGSQVISALKRLESVNVGFADAFLAAAAAEEKVPVASFDRDFDKFKDIARHDPSTAKKASG